MPQLTVILILGFAIATTTIFFHRASCCASKKQVSISDQRGSQTQMNLPRTSVYPDEATTAMSSVAADKQLENMDDDKNSNGMSMSILISRNFSRAKHLALNSHGILECEASGTPPPNIFWLKNGIPIETAKTRVLGDTGTANVISKFSLKCVHQTDEGNYTCVAMNKGKEARATTYVTVIDDNDGKVSRGSCEHRSSSRKGSAPLIILGETYHSQLMGRDIEIPCRFVGLPKPKLVWSASYPRKIITSGKKYRIKPTGSLLIRNLAWNDMGGYICTAENMFGKDSISTFVYPLSPDE